MLQISNQKQEFNLQAKATTKTVSVTDIPEIMNLIKSKSNSKLEFNFGVQENYAAPPSGDEVHDTNLIITQVMTDEIIASTLNGITNYAFQMTTNSNDYLLNLVVKQWYGINIIYFAKYVPNTNSPSIDFNNFTGDIYYYDEAGVYQAKVAIVGGTSSSNITYDAPCPGEDDNPIDPDDNDGSGSGGGGTIGGGNCYYEVIVSINECGGSNSGTEHIIESCGGDGSGGIVTTTFTWTCDNNQSAPPPEEIFFDPPCSNNGGGGSSGGPNSNSCPGAAPCVDELQSFDDNCDCVYVFNPITPVNNAEYTAARQNIKDCIGMYGSGFLDDLNNWSSIKAISDYITDNGCSLANQEFIKSIIDAWESNDFSALFALDIFNQDLYNVWKSLSQAEKDLIEEFPLEAFGIFKNRKIAEDETRARFGGNGLNDKSDAFRHAYYNVINAKVVGIDAAKLFSDAHESEVPNPLLKEKQMDLFNNNIGHQSISGNGNLSLSNLADLIFQKLLNGDLRYLSPLDGIASPPYDLNNDDIQDCPTCANEIISSTILTPTNQ